MIIYGSRMYGRRNPVNGWGYCDNCAKYGKHISYNGRMWGHLYFIPLIPEGPRVRVLKQCRKCSNGIHIPEEEAPVTLDNLRTDSDSALAGLVAGELEFEKDGAMVPCITFLADAVELLCCMCAEDHVRAIIAALQEKGLVYAHHLLNGKLLEFAGNRDEATLAYKEAAASDPANPLPMILLGAIHVDKKDYEGARLLYEKALELSSDKRAVYLVLLNIYDYLKDYSKTTETYEEIFRLMPELAQDKKTLKAYRKACKKAGKQPEVE